MYNLIRRGALAVLKIPAEPHPPMGDPASLRVFNAGKNYFRLKIAGWAVAQILALAGIIFWTTFLVSVGNEAREQKRAGIAPRRLEKIEINNWESAKQAAVDFMLVLPAGAFVLLWLIKLVSVAGYLIQLPLTYAIRRLDYEMRWYMVTDRSLRLRHGVWQISEATMSFANIQQVVVSQGPLQRLLGLGDVKVKSAGGGDTQQPSHHTTEDMHSGLFHCVTNAEEIRNLILDRLRRFRQAGLGDPDDKHIDAPPSTASHEVSSQAISAARTLAAEARALRTALTA
jgi:membrane protein YdbS with pleckstrin-like domain